MKIVRYALATGSSFEVAETSRSGELALENTFCTSVCQWHRKTTPPSESIKRLSKTGVTGSLSLNSPRGYPIPPHRHLTSECGKAENAAGMDK